MPGQRAGQQACLCMCMRERERERENTSGQIFTWISISSTITKDIELDDRCLFYGFVFPLLQEKRRRIFKASLYCSQFLTSTSEQRRNQVQKTCSQVLWSSSPRLPCWEKAEGKEIQALKPCLRPCCWFEGNWRVPAISRVLLARAEVSWHERPGTPAPPHWWASPLAIGDCLPGHFLLPVTLTS